MSSNTRTYFFALLCAVIFEIPIIYGMFRIGIHYDFRIWDYVAIFIIPVCAIIILVSLLAITLDDCDIINNDNSQNNIK